MFYVLWTNTGQEEKMRQMIYEFADPALYTRCLIPYRLKRHYYKGKSHLVKLILFPSYLFIETDHIKEFVNNIKWFPGLNVVLHIDDLYCPVYKHEETLLLKLVNDRDIIDISEGYIEGDTVKVTSGPLVGQEGNIKRIKRRQGAAILEMNIFNRKTEVSLGLELISK
ncbi:MAG: antiterminator LoaP [Anaerolineaceae bacterium]|nr:antiterminator LoaP [Anaerolineaceae bacterium]